MSETRRRYTSADKARAVGLAIVKGQRPAAEQLGIPLSTLHQWWEKPEYARLRTTAREDVASQMWIAVQIGVSEMLAGLRDGRTPLRDKTIAVSMLSEKWLLLTGQATVRTEHRELLADFDDHERQAVADWLRTLTETADVDG